MFPVVSQFLIELIKSPKRGLWATIIALVIVGNIGYDLAIARPERMAEMQSFHNKQKQIIDSISTNKMIQDSLLLIQLERIKNDLNEIKNDLKQTNQNVLEIYKGKFHKRQIPF